jgi:hypothetical protein
MPFFEIFCGFTSSLFIFPIMTLVDTSIIRSQINKTDFKKSISETTHDYCSRKIPFTPPACIMFSVYFSTYTTANITELYCKKHNIDYKIPTLITTSAVNITTIAYKDKMYSKMFSQIPHFFPKKSLALFAIRDMLTISSSFIYKKDAIEWLETYIPHNVADFIASMVVPITAQTISTPLHILAIDMYQNPTHSLQMRYKYIKETYKSVCQGRIMRVVPAFCIGGFINDMLRNRL